MKKQYKKPDIKLVTIANELCFTQASVIDSTTGETTDHFDVNEDKDPGNSSDGSWYDNTDNWGGD